MEKKCPRSLLCYSIPVDTGQISLYDLGVKKSRKVLMKELVRNIINGKKYKLKTKV